MAFPSMPYTSDKWPWDPRPMSGRHIDNHVAAQLGHRTAFDCLARARAADDSVKV